MRLETERKQLEKKMQNYIIPIYDQSKSNTKKVDYLLGKCYESHGKDYYDQNNNGKFTIFVNDNEMDTDIIMEQLTYGVDSHENKFIKFGVEDFNYYPNETYEVIKCFYAQKRLPTIPSINNLAETISSNECILKWIYIGHALKHELYDKISFALMTIVKNKTNIISRNDMLNQEIVDNVLKELKDQNKIDQKELDYIKKLIKRAILFDPIINPIHRNSAIEQATEYDENIDDMFSGLTINMLQDIYATHNCFLYRNYQFAEYKKQTMIENITNNKYFGKNKQDFASKIKSVIMEKISDIDLYPSYIIEDNLYIIWKYVFSVTHLVQKLIQNNSNNDVFTLNVFIIPKRIVSVYDTNIIYPVAIKHVSDYLSLNGCYSHKCLTMKPSEYKILSSLKIFSAQQLIIFSEMVVACEQCLVV
eukprot:447356_1